MGIGMKRQAQATVHVDAPPEVVWALVSDVTRGGEWSCESQGCTWLNGASSAVPGARFRGRNRRGPFQWSRTSEVIAAEPGREFVWRTLPSLLYRDSTQWRILLERDGEGTRVTEAFTLLFMNPLMETLIHYVMPAHRDRSGDLVADLQRLKVRVESL